MRRLVPFFLAALVAVAPARAQRTGPAFEVLRSAYVAVFDEPAYTFDLEIAYDDGDSTVVERGHATAQVSFDTGLPVFLVTLGDEPRRFTLDGETYQVDFPRGQKVYVDSTMDEAWSGSLWPAMMTPPFGVVLHHFVQDATRAEVVGADMAAGRPCTRAAFEVPVEAGTAGVSLCVDQETAFPVEVRLDDPDGSSVAVRYTSVTAVAARPAEAFRLDPADGYERVPYANETAPLAIGTAAPALVAEGDSGPVALADYRGRYVLLDFWGTWCAPCVGEIPVLQAKADAYPDLVVLGLAAHEYPDADPARFVRQRGGAYPVARVDDATLEAYHVVAFPTYYLVGPDGAVLFASVADRDPGADDALDALLASLFSD